MWPLLGAGCTAPWPVRASEVQPRVVARPRTHLFGDVSLKSQSRRPLILAFPPGGSSVVTQVPGCPFLSVPRIVLILCYDSRAFDVVYFFAFLILFVIVAKWCRYIIALVYKCDWV